jgi:hypothetical protein
MKTIPVLFCGKHVQPYANDRQTQVNSLSQIQRAMNRDAHMYCQAENCAGTAYYRVWIKTNGEVA